MRTHSLLALLLLSGCSSSSEAPAATDAGSAPAATTDAGSSPAADAGAEGGPAGVDAGPVTTCDFLDEKRTVGLTRCQAGAESGYILYPHKHRADVYLIDHLGRVAHHWGKSAYEPGQSAYLRDNGNLVRAAMKKGASIGGGEGGRVEEYDWNDALVWAFDFNTDAGTTHHDFKILPNGNLLMLAVEKKLPAEAATKGFDTTKMPDGHVAPEMLVELKKTGATTYEIVWEWHVWDHLIQNKNAALSNYGDPQKNPGKVQVTGAAPAFWNHANSVHYDPTLDQIVVSARSHNELWILDHSTTTAEAKTSAGGKRGKGGDFIYRWGNPQQYSSGTAADRKLYNQHDAQWIEPGLPGAGHLLVFNNGLDRPDGAYSTLDELIAPVQPDGSYPTLSVGAAFGPTSLTWQYKATPPTSFYGSEISGTQRLPNGNTMACEGTTGRFLEVTAGGKLVWEYKNPVSNSGPMTQYELAPLDPKGHPESAVFKVHWYPASFPGFVGKDLTPGAVIERSDAACPSSNVNYACKAATDCKAAGGADLSGTFACGTGNVCCFKLTTGSPP